MASTTALPLLLALLVCCTSASHFFHRPAFKEASNADSGFNGTKGVIQQNVDNFDPNNKLTYNQRYWYNPNFRKPNTNIAFLLIQGEATADDLWITNPEYTYLKLAASYGADAFQLEHRCFGLSRPFNDTSFEHIQYCNVDQALADIHEFIGRMNGVMGYKNPKWITFGGSYPGALSALFRAKYPGDTVGAVASSAPMLWTLDFFQYAQVVNFVLNDTDPNCWKATNDAFNQMVQLGLSNEGRQLLNGYFNLKPAFVDNQATQHDVDNFFSNVFGVFQDTIQYTYDGRNAATKNGLGAAELCKRMTDASEPNVVKRVNNVLNWYNTMTGQPTGSLDNDYNSMIKQLASTSYDDQDNSDARGWMWLCCNQLGVLQTTDQGRNAFQQTIPLNYFLDMCTDMFGPQVDVHYVRDRNQAFFNQYGGAEGYKATNVVLPNGAYDPWHVLGAYGADKTNHVTPILIDKAAHCSDMYPKYANEPKGLDDARNIINNEVAYFLGVDPIPIKYSCC